MAIRVQMHPRYIDGRARITIRSKPSGAHNNNSNSRAKQKPEPIREIKSEYIYIQNNRRDEMKQKST